MTLKRKRSEPELCSSPSSSSSSSSVFSSPPTNNTMDISPQAFYNMPPARFHLNSRTMKRFRDNRPSEEQVHQHTLNLLFSAQQQPRNTLPSSFHSCAPASDASLDRKQHSLHRFWSINSAPAVVTGPPMIQQREVAPSSCEDCGAGLGDYGSGSDMDMDMDVDGSAIDNPACGACGKHVCFSCSVSNLGDEKRCLRCAGR